MIQDKYKFVYVYTQIENVSEVNLQSKFKIKLIFDYQKVTDAAWVILLLEEPYKFEYIWDTQRLVKNSPIISWEMYIDYLRVEQKRHPQEQPEIYIDEVMAIQTDSGIGKALMK